MLRHVLSNRVKKTSYCPTPVNCLTLFPVLISGIAIAFGVLGEDYSASSGPWCWIKDCDTIPLNPVFWMFITGKAWEIVAYVGTFTIYMLLKADRWNRLKKVNVETILYNLLFI